MPKQSWAQWGKGLVAAVIGGGANAVTNVIVAPEVFNMGEGLGKLLAAAGVSALFAAALYLKQSPLPKDE